MKKVTSKNQSGIHPLYLFLRMWICLLSLGCLLFGQLESAFEFKPPSARSVGMGRAFAGLANDTNAIDYNPAGLRLIPGNQFSSTYSNLYGVEGLNYTQLKMAIPVIGYGTFGALFSDFGPSEYKERVLVFSHGFGLAEGIMMGYNLKSMGVSIEEYGSDSAFGIDVGILARVSDGIGLGACARNINEPEISQGNEKLPEEFAAGLYYVPVQGLNFAFDIDKVLDQPLSLHIGTEFRLLDFLAFRTGIQTNPSNYSFGFGLNYGTIYFDYGYQAHATLDDLHVFSLAAKFGGEKEASLKYTPKKSKDKKPRISRRRKTVSTQDMEEAETALREKVNINTASEEEIATLPSVSKLMAKRIADYREANGPFKSVEDLKKVPRMSERTYARIEGMLTVGSAAPVQENIQKEELPADEDEEAGEEIESAPVVPAKTQTPPPAEEEKQELAEEDKINVNRASLPQLLDIGFTTVQAESILKHIREKGPLSSIEDIKKIQGIPADIVDEIKGSITVR